jgi:hypothetical protein
MEGRFGMRDSLGAHGGYLNGSRNASPALAPGRQKTSRPSCLSATAIRVLPTFRFHSGETMKPPSWHVSSSTNTMAPSWLRSSHLPDAPTVRFLIRDRACVVAGSATGIDRWYTGSRRGDLPAARPGCRRPLSGRGISFMASRRSQRRPEGRLSGQPGDNPVSKPRVLDGGDMRTRRAGYVPSPRYRPHHGGPTWQS